MMVLRTLQTLPVVYLILLFCIENGVNLMRNRREADKVLPEFQILSRRNETTVPMTKFDKSLRVGKLTTFKQKDLSQSHKVGINYSTLDPAVELVEVTEFYIPFEQLLISNKEVSSRLADVNLPEDPSKSNITLSDNTKLGQSSKPTSGQLEVHKKSLRGFKHKDKFNIQTIQNRHPAKSTVSTFTELVSPRIMSKLELVITTISSLPIVLQQVSQTLSRPSEFDSMKLKPVKRLFKRETEFQDAKVGRYASGPRFRSFKTFSSPPKRVKSRPPITPEVRKSTSRVTSTSNVFSSFRATSTKRTTTTLRVKESNFSRRIRIPVFDSQVSSSNYKKSLSKPNKSPLKSHGRTTFTKDEDDILSSIFKKKEMKSNQENMETYSGTNPSSRVTSTSRVASTSRATTTSRVEEGNISRKIRFPAFNSLKVSSSVSSEALSIPFKSSLNSNDRTILTKGEGDILSSVFKNKEFKSDQKNVIKGIGPPHPSGGDNVTTSSLMKLIDLLKKLTMLEAKEELPGRLKSIFNTTREEEKTTSSPSPMERNFQHKQYARFYKNFTEQQEEISEKISTPSPAFTLDDQMKENLLESLKKQLGETAWEKKVKGSYKNTGRRVKIAG